MYRSPVLGRDGEVAYDILIFDITSVLHKLSTQTLNTQVLDKSAYQQLISSGDLIKTDGEAEIFSTQDTFLVSVGFLDNTFFITQESRGQLLEPLYSLRNMIFPVGISLLISFIIVVYFYLIRYAHKELLRLESRQDVLQKIAEKAKYDTLTSAGSRSSGERSLEMAFERFKSEQVSPAVMMFDVDNLKNINVSYGHAVGDAVLRSLTSTVYHVIRDNDQLFRWAATNL